jgi:hypothetical protein
MEDKEMLEQIMNHTYNPREVARNQFNAYKQYIVSTLNEIIEGVENEDFAEIIKNMTAHSPSGDYTGKDNVFINFGYGKKARDIREALNHLQFLKDYADDERAIDDVYEEDLDYLGIGD